ncbi:MAG: hypothetical protein R6X02_14235 [Enhygromyxa sp.]
MAWQPPADPAFAEQSPARVASEPTRVAIAPTAYSSVIPQHTRDAVRAVLGEAVQKIANNPLLLDVDAECRARECVLRQARDAHAEYLLELRLTLEQRDYAIEIEVIAAADGRRLARVEGVCRLCAQAELLAEIATQVMTLQEALDSSATRGREHRAEDHAAPVASARTRQEAGGRGLTIGGWVSFTLGLAGVGAGAALLSIDGLEHGPTCGVEVRDIHGACPNVYTTGIAGAVSVGLGGAALVTGAGLLIAGGARRERGARARLSPAPGGLRLEF